MTASGKHILDEFVALPDQEKKEVLSGILRLVAELDYPETSDEDFRAAAEAVFLEYDRRESEH